MSIARYNPDAPLFIVMESFDFTGREANVAPGASINDIISGIAASEYTSPQYVLEIREGVSRDISEDIARTVVGLAEQEAMDLTQDVIAFCQEYEALPVDCSAFEGGRVVRSEAA